jgi:hypothetical protein
MLPNIYCIVFSPPVSGLRQENKNAYPAFPLAHRSWSVSVRLPEFDRRPHLSLPHRAVGEFHQRAASTALVYTTGGAIATSNDNTGVLSPTSASRLALLGFPAVLDVEGRFLFAAGSNSIYMYQVDSVTGSYTEVHGSPFASANTNTPVLLATEPTGSYLAVVNSIGLNLGESSVESYQINAAAEALVPISGSFLELVSTSIGAAANPATGKFYIYLGPNPLSSNPF